MKSKHAPGPGQPRVRTGHDGGPRPARKTGASKPSEPARTQKSSGWKRLLRQRLKACHHDHFDA